MASLTSRSAPPSYLVSPHRLREFPTSCFGRIRLTFLVAGVIALVVGFLILEKDRGVNSFPTFEPGRYVGTISDIRPSGSSVILPMVVDVPAPGAGLLLIIEEQGESGVVIRPLNPAKDSTDGLLVSVSGGEQITLFGTQEEDTYRGLGKRSSGSDLKWILRRVNEQTADNVPELSEFLAQRAKLALIERRIEAAKAGVAKATDESAFLKQTSTQKNGSNKSILRDTPNADTGKDNLTKERSQVESKRSELAQKIALVESVAPGSRVSRAAYRSLAEESRWIDSILLGASTTPISQEDTQALAQGLEVDRLQRAIVAAQRRIDTVLRASEDVLGE